jgi:hypothetical protein
MLARTENGCACLFELTPEMRPPANGARVKIYGITLGVPGFSRLQLMVLDMEVRT